MLVALLLIAQVVMPTSTAVQIEQGEKKCSFLHKPFSRAHMSLFVFIYLAVLGLSCGMWHLAP